MKKTFLFFMLVFISSFVTGNLYADNHNCSYPPSQTHNQYCKGQIATKYIDRSVGYTVDIKISITSKDVMHISGPYVPTPSWSRSGNNEITITLRTSELVDGNEGWIELIMSDGKYYHVKLIYM